MVLGAEKYTVQKSAEKHRELLNTCIRTSVGKHSSLTVKIGVNYQLDNPESWEWSDSLYKLQ